MITQQMMMAIVAANVGLGVCTIWINGKIINRARKERAGYLDTISRLQKLNANQAKTIEELEGSEKSWKDETLRIRRILGTGPILGNDGKYRYPDPQPVTPEQIKMAEDWLEGK